MSYMKYSILDQEINMYDSKIIQLYAEKLYTQAVFGQIFYTLVGFFIPVIFGAFSENLEIGFFIGVLLGFGGFFLSRERAFQLKLQAQIALCQMQIEMNTRGKSQVSQTSGEHHKSPENDISILRENVATRQNVTPIASNYRTCLRCLNQNPKEATYCQICKAKLS